VSIDSKLPVYLTRLKRSVLKPQQKLFILRVFLIPRLIYELSMDRPYASKLQKYDRLIRKFLTGTHGILHLPQSTPSAFFYAPGKHGGLGLMSFRVSVPGMIASRFDRMSTSDSKYVRSAAKAPAIISRISRAKAIMMKGGELEVGNATLAQRYHTKQLHEKVDGQALAHCSDVPEVHTWLSDGTRMMSGQAFVESVKIRINAMPTLSRTTRGTNRPRSCRAGCGTPETLNHVLQVCHRTDGIRTKRHDVVKNKLASFLQQKGLVVENEPHIPVDGGVSFRKPDIIAIKGKQATVIDVQICGEYHPDNAHRNKVLYYQRHEEIHEFCKARGAEQVKFSACVISYRGVMSGLSASNLKTLGITKAMLKTLVVMSMERTTHIWHVFRKSTAHTWRRKIKAKW